MAAICGRGGKVIAGTKTCAHIGEWTMSIPGVEPEDITSLGATAKAFLACTLPGPATGTCTWKALDNADEGAAAVRAAVLAGTSIALDLYESATKFWDGADAYITNFSQTVGVDGPVGGSFDFQFATIPTYT